jgi:hypothetical protein
MGTGQFIFIKHPFKFFMKWQKIVRNAKARGGQNMNYYA